MRDIDALSRGAAIGTALVLGLAFWRIRGHRGIGWIAAFLFADDAAYLLAVHLADLAWPLPALFAIAALSASLPFFFWLLARIVFDDDFRLQPVHFLWLAWIEAAAIALFISVFLVRGGPAPRVYSGLGLAFRLPSLALVAHALWTIGRGRSADLVEARAKLRVVVLFVAGLMAAFILVAAMLYGPVAIWPPALQRAQAVILLLINIAVALQLMRVDSDLLPDIPRSRLPQALENNGVRDAETLARLQVLMEREEVWHESGLTIGTLAMRVGVPEYRLRHLINRRLGFRNFTSFLNDYRLGAAATQLADPEQARIPVLTIALDLGWGSIGPFNRAFRARFEMTPSDYRRRKLEAAATR